MATASSSTDNAKRSRTSDDSLEAQVAQLQKDLKAIAGTIAGMAESRVAETRDTAEHEVKHLVRSGQHAVEGLQDEIGQMEKQVKDAIRRRPLTAVAGAVAAGFVIAMLSR